MTTLMKKTLLPAVAMTFALFASAQVKAATYNIDTQITGPDGGSGIAATYEINQNGSNVDFRLNNLISNLTTTNANSFISQFLFAGPSNLTANQFVFSSSEGASLKSIDTTGTTNASYNFAIDFGFDVSNGPHSNRFLNGESFTWSIKNITASSFETGNPLGMIHVQGLNSGASAKYATSVVPVPAAAWLFGSALLGLTGVSRRKKTNTAVVEA